jgi:hypothetical protein
LSSPTLRREQNGKQTVDWVGFMGDIFEKMAQADAPAVNYSKTPADPKPARDLAAYAGHYGNSYYGPLVISKKRNGLSMTMGPQTMPTTFALTHFDGDMFSFETVGDSPGAL